MTYKVKLEDGSEKRFKKSDIINSLETVGLDHKMAKNIAKEVSKHKGMTEHEIKVHIFDKLDKLDPKKADLYFKTKKVHVGEESIDFRKNAFLPEFLMDYLEVGNGTKIDVFHKEKTCTMSAHKLDDRFHKEEHHDRIFLSHSDMKDLDLKPDSMVAICKHAS